MSDFTHYFGFVDAADDSKLKNYFYRAPLFDQVKKGKQDFWDVRYSWNQRSGQDCAVQYGKEDYRGALVFKVDKSEPTLPR